MSLVPDKGTVLCMAMGLPETIDPQSQKEVKFKFSMAQNSKLTTILQFRRL